MNKATLQEIETRFDNDVERFSNLETGQATTLDAVWNMELITDAIVSLYPNAQNILDIGCGAGNYDVKLLQKLESNPNVSLLDLSQPMLNRAKERVGKLTNGEIHLIKGDFRTAALEEDKFDVIIATSVLHHLRDDKDWENAFGKLFRLLRTGGSVWIFDLIEQNNEQLQKLIYREKYGEYLTSLKDEQYRDHVFDYIEHEDTPRSLIYQLNLLTQVGFKNVDVLHKNLCFASYMGFK
ncbi:MULTISPECIES: class I SAM-dependent methyltransferase [Sphingobacterium]|jgi:tRNA (cmo5U34)-methyltransferase|uniref:Demethylmenaquinone methyltransferase n=1 Tax=Sphingobacterium multivorum TaxID=28454 RepID=A0A653YZQ3_SPHMU|nr:MULTISPECIES: class I SAM-dependent methyltransferase [Sphingobacterium]HAE66314.1 class I SAM-dependent methyltransferase [Sphingobacterium sp.]KKO93164.1 methyltransferase type 11 [Sphingobacterium sp. Ag1]MDF2853730.1 SAM-dependent methyltransferase [Sphingobacterium multivorum]OFV13641.1 methyltransferase type 11 [Sphingobacterium sp. HMSC13C05]OJZ02961.1 MAG: methyltransferase type 11 [Sphingobacterium sp. 40-24]